MAGRARKGEHGGRLSRSTRIVAATLIPSGGRAALRCDVPRLLRTVSTTSARKPARRPPGCMWRYMSSSRMRRGSRAGPSLAVRDKGERHEMMDLGSAIKALY